MPRLTVNLYRGGEDSKVFGRYENGRIDLNIDRVDKSGKSMVMYTLSHELTHYIKEASGAKYRTFAEVLTDHIMDEEGKTLERLIREKKARDSGISDEEAMDEIVADGCELMLENTEIFNKLAQKDKSLAQQVADYIKSMLKRMYEGITGKHYEAKVAQKYISELQELWDTALEDALTGEESVTETKEEANNKTSPDRREKFSFVDYAEDGRGRYKSDYPKGTPKEAKAKDILSYIQNVWSKKPISLVIWKEGKKQTIKAQFDPTYGETKRTFNDATKLMGGNRMGNATEQRVTLDLASDYYKIASESTYNHSKDEDGKDNPAHKGVKIWQYFMNGIYFSEFGSENYEPYVVTINVKEKDNGTFVYSFSAEKEKRLTAPGTLHAPVSNTFKGETNSNPLDSIVSSENEKSKRKSVADIDLRALENEINSAGLKLTSKDNNKNNLRVNEFIKKIS